MYLVRAAQCAHGSSTLSEVCCSIGSKGARPLCCAMVGDLEMRNQPPNKTGIFVVRRTLSRILDSMDVIDATEILGQAIEGISSVFGSLFDGL